MPVHGKVKISKVRSGGLILVVSICIALIFLIGLSCNHNQGKGIEPSELKCEYSDNPLGIENINPRLSWILNSDRRNQKQSAFRILVAGSKENIDRNIGDLWDSHKIISGESVHNEYKGKRLSSGMRCWWKVCVWDKNNIRSNWSESAYWEMGLLNPADWKAKWISYECKVAPLFRTEFKIIKEVKEARVYISGLGYYELSINGSKIGENVLDPGQTDYEKRTFYVVYEVTDNIKIGENAIGIILGNGWYNQSAVNHGKYGWNDVVYGRPGLIFQMRILYCDGTEKLFISDETWKSSSGPVISDNVYAGEIYDARLEQKSWDSPGFDDSKWNQVLISESPGGKLVSQKLPPIKRMGRINPVGLNNPSPGVYVYDLGQNFAGWAKLNLTAPAGTEIRLRFSESLHPDGMIDPASTGVYATDVVQTDKYTCSGKGEEVWEPRFTYHGFRYIEMTGFPGKPSSDNIEGVVVHTSVKKTGEFICSDTMFNKLHKTALWTELSNMYSIPTDCPHREKCGWLGDAFLTSDMTIYNFDVALFWSKFLDDIETSRIEGIPSNIAPGRRFGGCNPDWGAAYIQLALNMYLYYGDKTIINEHYEGMGFFMNHLQKIAVGNIVYSGIGSLFSPGRIMPLETPKEFTSTVLYYFCTDAMSQMARAIGKVKDSQKYSSSAQNIKSSFNNKFYDSSKKTYGCQEKNTLALHFGLVPDNDNEAVARNLYDYVVNQKRGYVSTGIFGTRYIYETLAKYGYGETVKEILNQTTFPSYGFLFSRGATTFWENWGEKIFDDKGKTGDERSRNHPFQGGFDAWFYNGIGGITPDPGDPGFKHIILKPDIIKTMDYGRIQYNSMYGLIKSEWSYKGNEFRWLISIPVNTTATVYFPAVSKDKISEGGVPATETEGAKFLRMENGCAVFEIGSGNFEFIVTKNNSLMQIIEINGSSATP
jgi:alpha-L-rhamnosidase